MSAQQEDADLNDLIHDDEEEVNENGASKRPSSEEDDSETEELVPSKKEGKKSSADRGDDDKHQMPDFNPFGKICLLFHLTFLLATTRPNVTLCVGALLLIVLIVSLVYEISKARSQYPTFAIEHDYSDINSIYDLKLGQIDHWCIFGGDDGCSCDDPLIPISHGELPGWMKAHKLNKRLIDRAVRTNRDIDVAFLGDSITEEWAGRWLGRNHTRFEQIGKVFDRYLTKGGGAKYDGLPLGVAGDTSPNLLWRIRKGEMPSDFNPKVWWLLIGINDLGKQGCSGEVTLLGILRVIEEIQARKPGAIIVINGILPTAASAYERPKPRVIPPKQTMTKQAKKTLKDRYKKSEDLKDLEPTDKKEKARLPFVERKRKVLLPTTRIINRQLERFSEKHKKVYYFDAGNVFYFKDEKGRKILNKDLMLDGVHPTDMGHKLWAKEIVKKLDEIFAKEEEEMLKNLPLRDEMDDDLYMIFEDDDF